MSEAGDYEPAGWRGHDFDDARRAYRAHVNSSYADAQRSGTTVRHLVVEQLSTASSCPVVVAIDVTGSMGEWPATIFSKLPYFEHEAKTEYRGEDVEVSFCAVGDCKSDRYPLQVRPFTKGEDLAVRLKELVIEGGGGGSTHESYQLTGLYYARRVEMPRATMRPLLIFIGDESPYSVVTVDEAKMAHCALERDMAVEDVFVELKQKWSVYFIQKPYGGTSANNWREPTTARVHSDWAKLVGEDHIACLPEAARVVDVIFGILAQEADRVAYFREEIESRQRPDQVGPVYRSLESIHSVPSVRRRDAASRAGHSVLHTQDGIGGKPSKPLV